MPDIKQIQVGGSTYDIVDQLAQDRLDEIVESTETKGSSTKGVYLSNGQLTPMTYALNKTVPSDAVFTDTKNTAGSTDTSSKIFLVGATSQAANPQTYSQDTAYVGTDGCLYSGGVKVLTSHQDISGKANATEAGYSLSVSGTSVSLKNKAGTVLSTITTQDTNTTYSAATTSAAGLMSAADKTKLNGIATGANNYSLPTASASTLGGVKVGTNLSISNGVLSATDTTYGVATTSANGLMSSTDKSKLDGIASGATANTGTVTSVAVKMNGSTKGTVTTSGTIDLGTVLTSHQDISGKADKASITAGTAGTSSATSGSSLAVPYVTMNAQGIVTGYGTHTHTVTGFLTSHQDISGKANATEAGYSLSVSGTSVSLKNKAGTVLSTITTQDTNTTYSAATTSAAGLMSAADKTKLNGIATGANNYSLPTASASTLGGVKVGTNLSISNGVLSATDTTYSTATTSANGLMSSTDKSKLDGIASGANNYSHPTTTAKTAAAVKVGNDAAGHVVIGDALTKSDLGLGNVENKSSATIRGELTKANVTTALGYTPPTTNTTYSNFVKSGSGAAAGLVPAPPTTAGTTKYLREDGTWQVPSGGSGATKLYMHTVCFAFDVDGDEVDYNISVLSSSSQRLFSLSGSTVTITAIPGCVPFTIEGRYVTKAGGIAYIYVSGSTKKLFYSLGSAGTFLNVTLSTMNESTDEIIENIYEI